MVVEHGRITSYNVCYTKLLRAGNGQPLVGNGGNAGVLAGDHDGAATVAQRAACPQQDVVVHGVHHGGHGKLGEGDVRLAGAGVQLSYNFV